MFKIDLITLFAAFGAFQGIVFSVILWFRKKSKQTNKIFALLMLATSIRIAKNVVVHIRDIDPNMEMSEKTWRILVNLGLTHQFAIGPLFLLFFLSRTTEKFNVTRTHYWHFLPYMLLLLSTPFQPWKFWSPIGLWLSYISILFYYLWSAKIYFSAKQKYGSNEGLDWLRNLLILSGLLLLAYSPALFKYIGYIGGAALYAIGIYSMSMMVLGRDRFFEFFQHKYPGSSLTNNQSKEILERLNHHIQVEQAYLEPELSLSKLADILGISSNALSQLINTHYQKSYSDYINELRLNKAKEMLLDPAHAKTKIVAIAFDCGFNGLSTFNTVFKKKFGMPPNQFRNQNMTQ